MVIIYNTVSCICRQQLFYDNAVIFNIIPSFSYVNDCYYKCVLFCHLPYINEVVEMCFLQRICTNISKKAVE